MHRTVLTIAGFDPSSGAGVTADLMVFAAHGLFGTACITALTVQSTLGVQSTHPTPADVVGATLYCLDGDLTPEGIKIGMLSSSANIFIICEYFDKLRSLHEDKSRPQTVFDPVLRSSSGRELVDPAGLGVVRDRLLPLVDWITPNLEELGSLANRIVSDQQDVPDACQALQQQTGTRPDGRRLGIIATGGHLERPDDYLLLPSGEGYWLRGERVVTEATHGTGCAFSSAFLSRLVLGDVPLEAAKAAKEYVAQAMRTAIKRGAGKGPMNLLWPLALPLV